MKNYISHIIPIFLAIIVFTISCEESSEPIPVAVNSISDLVVRDVSNQGNANDIEVSFSKAENESDISEYRVFIVRIDFEEIMNVELATSFSNELFESVPADGSNKKFSLPANAKHIGGEELEVDQRYIMYIMSVSNGIVTNKNRLSSPSSVFKISEDSDEARNLFLVDVGNSQNSSDFQLRFSKAFNEEKVSSYRAFIILSEKSDNYTLEEAQLLNANQYLEISPKAEDQVVNFGDNLLDADGRSITNDKPYQAMILSVEDGVIALKKTLSSTSNILELKNISYVKTITDEFMGSGGLSYHPDGYLISGNAPGSYRSRRGNGTYKIDLNGDIGIQTIDLENCLGNVYGLSENVIYQTTKNGIFKIDNKGASTLLSGSFIGPFGKTNLTFPTDVLLFGNAIIASDCERGEFYTIQESAGGVSQGIIAYNDTSSFIQCPRYIELNNKGDLIILNFNDNSMYVLSDYFGFLVQHISIYVSLRIDEQFVSMISVPSKNIIYATTSDNRLISIEEVNPISRKVTHIAGIGSGEIIDGSLSQSAFINPINIVASQDGNKLYVLDQINPADGISVVREVEIVN